MKRWSGLLAVVLVGPWVLAAPVAQQGPKVLLIYDMEGVTGAVKPSDVNFGSDGYPATRESLTEDVNAAIRGLLKGGAREVVITDGHGSGNPDPDYLLDRLPNGARFDLRSTPWPWTPASIQAPFENRFSYILPEQAAVAISYPGATVVDNKTVALRANTFLEAYLAFRALANFTSYATSRMIAGWLRDVDGSGDILRKLQERLPSRAQRTFAPTGNEIERSYSRHGYR